MEKKYFDKSEHTEAHKKEIYILTDFSDTSSPFIYLYIFVWLHVNIGIIYHSNIYTKM